MTTTAPKPAAGRSRRTYRARTSRYRLCRQTGEDICFHNFLYATDDPAVARYIEGSAAFRAGRIIHNPSVDRTLLVDEEGGDADDAAPDDSGAASEETSKRTSKKTPKKTSKKTGRKTSKR